MLANHFAIIRAYTPIRYAMGPLHPHHDAIARWLHTQLVGQRHADYGKAFGYHDPMVRIAEGQHSAFNQFHGMKAQEHQDYVHPDPSTQDFLNDQMARLHHLHQQYHNMLGVTDPDPAHHFFNAWQPHSEAGKRASANVLEWMGMPHFQDQYAKHLASVPYMLRGIHPALEGLAQQHYDAIRMGGHLDPLLAMHNLIHRYQGDLLNTPHGRGMISAGIGLNYPIHEHFGQRNRQQGIDEANHKAYMDFLEHGMGGTDTRPNETVPEDYYALKRRVRPCWPLTSR